MMQRVKYMGVHLNALLAFTNYIQYKLLKMVFQLLLMYYTN